VTRIAIVVGTTRPGRKAVAVAEWVLTEAVERGDAVFELVDIADYALPLLDEPAPPAMGRYARAHTRDWAARIASFDAYVLVTPEYNRSVPGSLKNAIDFLFAEWHNKAAGFVSYGSTGGVRAVEHLRLVMGELQVADVRTQVVLTLSEDFAAMTDFQPRPDRRAILATMLDQLVAWAGALKALRTTMDQPAKPVGAPPRSGRRILILGRSAQVQATLTKQLQTLGLDLDIETSTDTDNAAARFDARHYDLIVFGRGIVGPISHRLRGEFAYRNPNVDLLDAWSPVAARQIAAAVTNATPMRPTP
jgi:NAD(P)H-dependent FMN reductase